VADAPVEELVERAEELARRWIVALVAARALGQMAGVSLQLLAREAPALCARLARALRSDTELAQLLEAPDAREDAGAERSAGPWAWIAADGDASVVVHDVEALRSVLWAALREELRDPPPSQLADLADRLAFVCASLLAAVLARYSAPVSAGTGAASPHTAGRAGQVLYSSPASGASGRAAVLIDELADASVGSVEAGAVLPRSPAAPRQAPAGARASGPSAAPRARRGGPAQASPRARPWDTPLNIAPGEEHSRRHDPVSASSADGADPQDGPAVRVTRGPGSPLDRRA
jgi:hypothetical protein